MTKSERLLELLERNTFYVFFADGTWRTATSEEWQNGRLWERDIDATGWVGGPIVARVLKTLIGHGSKSSVD